MSIYTRRGDDGETSLGDGSRVSKDSKRVEAYGTIDEACSAVGFARAVVRDPEVGGLLSFIHQRLMNCAALTAQPVGAGSSERARLSGDDVTALERSINHLSARTGAWTGFVLGAGSEAAARLHLARAITRRAERRLVALAALESVDPMVLAFVNRASDALYAAALAENLSAGCAEEPWDPSVAPGF
jgi:cob(I)alamin adenosyltransferase